MLRIVLNKINLPTQNGVQGFGQIYKDILLQPYYDTHPLKDIGYASKDLLAITPDMPGDPGRIFTPTKRGETWILDGSSGFVAY